MGKTKKIILSCILAILPLFLCGAALLPTLLSTPLGNQLLIKFLNQKIPGSISAHSIRLGWFGPQRVEDLHLKDVDSTPILSLKSATIERSLFALLLSQFHDLGELNLQDPNLLYSILPGGGTNWQRALNISRSSNKTDKSSWSFPIKGEVHIAMGEVEIRPLHLEPILFKDFSFILNTDEKEGMAHLQCSAKTQQGNVFGSLNIEGTFDAHSTLTSSLRNLSEINTLNLIATINSFPVALLDPLYTPDQQPPHASQALSTLLGPTLNAHGQVSIHQNELQVALNVDSQSLQGSLLGNTEKGVFLLKPESNFQCEVSPTAFKKFLVPNSPWSLQTPTKIQFVIDKCLVPLKESEKGTCQGHFVFSPLQLHHAELGIITFKPKQLALSTLLEQREIKIDLDTYIESKLGKSHLDGSLSLSQLWNSRGEFRPEEVKYTFLGSASTLPTELLSIFFKNAPPLSLYLGNSLTSLFQGHWQKGAGEVRMSLTTPILYADKLIFKIDREFALAQPVMLSYRFTPTLLSKWSKAFEAAHVVESPPALLRVNQLSFAMQGDKRNFNLDIDADVPSLAISNISYLRTAHLFQVKGKFTLHPSSDLHLLLKGKVAFSDQKEGVLLFFGKEGEFSFSLDGPTKNFSSIGAEYSSDRFYASMQGRVNSQGQLTLLKPAQCSFTLTPEIFEKWIAKADVSSLPELSQSSRISLVLNSFEMPFSDFSLQNISLSSFITAQDLFLKDENLLEQTHVRDLRVSLNIDRHTQSLHAAATGKTSLMMAKQSPKEGIIDASLKLNPWLKQGRVSLEHLLAHVELKEFPVVLLDALLKQDGKWSAFIGPSLNLNLDYQNSDDHKVIALQALSTGFKADVAFKMGETLQLLSDHPAFIHWEMTPERYNLLLSMLQEEKKEPESEFYLISSTPVILTISSLNCPKVSATTLSAFLCRSGFVGVLQTGPLSFLQPKTQSQFSIQGLQLSVQGENFAQALSLVGHGDLKSSSLSGMINFQGQLLNAWTPKGHWNREGLTLRGKCTLERVPTHPLMHILPIQPETKHAYEALFGGWINAELSGEISQLSGPIDLTLESSNLKAVAPIQLKNGDIALRERLQAEITLTPEVSEAFLKDINPLLIEAAYSDHPIRLFVEPDDFLIPMHPYSFSSITIGKAVIDIGRIHVKNGGNIQALMQFLKAKKVSTDGQMEAWFTPIFMSQKNGISYYRRFDALLAGNIHIAGWGNIDLLNDKVRMILAISPTTLQQRLGILGLTKSEMFQVKMRGSTSKVKMDWSSAYARIGMILTRTAGGPTGYIVGGILELLNTVLGDEPSPSPTTSPFPWEKHAQVQKGMPVETTKKERAKGLRKLLDILIP